jgi:hypothetical protein
VFLRFKGIAGDDLHEPQEADGKGALNRHRDTPTLNRYFVSGHVRPR